MRGLSLSIAALAMIAAPALAQDVQRGEKVFEQWCIACHGAGEMYPGTQALAMLHEGNLPAALAERDDLDGDYVEYIVRNGLSVMPFFRMTEIDQTQMADLKAYLSRNAQN